MNLAHVHLILNHVPVIGIAFGFLLLVGGMMKKNSDLMKASLVCFAILAVIALPVFFTGEPAEERVEHLPGVSESMIERHEDAAKIALAAVELLGLVALGGLIVSRQGNTVTAGFVTIALVLSVITGGLMARTANLGGQIRHTEIRSKSRFAAATEATGWATQEGFHGRKQDD